MATLRAALHTYGANLVGAIELTEENRDHMERLFDVTGTQCHVVWDLPPGTAPYDEAGIKHIPSDCNYVLTWMTKQNYQQNVYGLNDEDQNDPTYDQVFPLGAQAAGMAYSHAAQTKYMAMRFIKTLGYKTISNQSGHSICRANVALGIFSGLGEQGRTGHVCTPEYGLGVRYTAFCITDLPLAPTKPIDAGIVNFCKVCKRCADVCPADAVDTADDLCDAGDTQGSWNRPGYQGWRMHWDDCTDWGAPINCGSCQIVCPYNQLIKNIGNSIPRVLISKLKDGAELVGDHWSSWINWAEPLSEKELEDWWDRDLDRWKYDTLLGFGQEVW
ncbi:hypothetical protein ES703_78304 [subsurface metagenome]